MLPLPGGYGGETFLVGSPGDEVVLRIYGRNPDRCLVDAALLRLLEGVIPVPHIVECRPAVGVNPGVLVTERLPGLRLDLVLADANQQLRLSIARELGYLLASLSGMPQLRFGMFVDAHLATSADGVPDSLQAWSRHFRESGGLAAWSVPDFDALLSLAHVAEELFMGPDGSRSGEDPGVALRRHVLVHGDLNPKNILVDPETGQITGVLDWEFAHAGSPYTDLGNLTRFDRQGHFLAEILDSLVARAPGLADDPLTLARAADLWALLELAGRPGPRDPVQNLAETLLLAQSRDQDLHAWPWDSPRVDPACGEPVS